jgi:hypothetical protein
MSARHMLENSIEKLESSTRNPEIWLESSIRNPEKRETHFLLFFTLHHQEANAVSQLLHIVTSNNEPP